MTNLLQDYLDRHNLRMSSFAKLMKVVPSTVFQWKNKKMCPNPEMAWKIQKITHYEIPITYWGYAIINGRMRKID